MSVLTESSWNNTEFTKSNIMLTERVTNKYTLKEKVKKALKVTKHFFRETTVEPCLFIYMVCIAISSLAVQNIHLEKSCRVNFQYSDEICDRIRNRNTTGLEKELNNVQSLVAQVIAWKFPLQTGIPALIVIFVGAWSDRTKRRKICILTPMIGEIITNIGLLLATYKLKEWSLETTALIEALPPAMTGSYIIIFMGMYSFMADRTSLEDRTFRLGIVTIFVNLGTPAGTAISGVLLRAIGYYGVFTLLLTLHCLSFIYGLVRLEDVLVSNTDNNESNEIPCKVSNVIFMPVANTLMVAFKSRPQLGRMKIFAVLILYFLMVGPLYGDSQVSYLYAIRKFNFTEIEYSLYGTINVLLGLFGTIFCISVLSKVLRVEDSAIGILAGTSRIASCFAFAFAPTREWFYAAPLFNIFSHTGLTAVRSIATKVVPLDEVAKLSSLMGVAEAFAPSVYMPISSYIYVSTIETFPGAFYLFDATLTSLALILFGLIYMLATKYNTTSKQNEIADESTQEISRF